MNRLNEVRQFKKIAGILKEELDLKSRLEIAQKAKNEIDGYLNGLGCKRISNEEAPSTKQNVQNRSTPTNSYTDNLKTWPNHWNDSYDEANWDNQKHEGRDVVYDLRIYAPNEDFDFKKISSIIRSAQREANSKGAAAFMKLSRSYKDIMAKLTISNRRKE